VSCASGTDALLMVLMAGKSGRGTPCCVIVHVLRDRRSRGADRATPVFVDVDEATYNMDATSLRRGIATAKQAA